MRSLLLGVAAAAAALALPAASAEAQSSFGTTADNGSRHHRDTARFSDGGFGRFQGCDFRDGGGRRHRGGDGDGRDRRHRRDRGGSCDISDGTWYEGGEWALYNNRSWEPDSYNDWWHDRPDRSYPRWMSSNKNCERQWWSGGGWRC